MADDPNQGRWVVRGGAFEAQLMAQQDNEGSAPPSGDTPKLEVHWDDTDFPVGMLDICAAIAQADADAAVLATVIVEAQERLPINPRNLTASATGAGTAAATMATAGVNLLVDEQIVELWQIPPPRILEFEAQQAAFGGEDIPVGARALSGTATGAGTATGTLSVSAAIPDLAPETQFLTSIELPRIPELEAQLVAFNGEDIPVGAKSLTASAAGVGTATGTLTTSAAIPDLFDETYPLATAEQPDATPTLIAELIAENEAIPVDGTVAVVTVQVPEDDDLRLATQPLDPEYPFPEPETLPVGPRALSGTASGAATATGTLTSSARIEPDVPPEFSPEPQQPEITDAVLPVGAVPLTASASGTATASATLAASAAIPDLSPETLATAAIEAPDATPTLQALAATENESIPVDGTVAVASVQVPEDDELRLLTWPPEPEFPWPEPEVLPIGPKPLSGTTTGAGTATATLTKSAAIPDLADETAAAASIVLPDAWPDTLAILQGEAERLPANPKPLTASASGTGTCSGTLSVGAFPFPPSDQDVALIPPEPPPPVFIDSAAEAFGSIPVVIAVPGTVVLRDDVIGTADVVDGARAAELSDSATATAALADVALLTGSADLSDAPVGSVTLLDERVSP